MSEGALRVSAVVCAFNEERNLPGLLDALTSYRSAVAVLEEILVVASGCTDATVARVEAAAERDARVRLLVQPQREGKASALAWGIASAREPILLVENADTLPTTEALDALFVPLHDARVALVTCRPVPVNASDGAAERLGAVLWEVHDRLSRRSPKVGEAFALRRELAQLPPDIEDDDTYLGAYATRRGGGAVYASSARIYNRVPRSLGELLRQRLRINRQVARLARRTGVRSSAWDSGRLALAVVEYLTDHPDRVLDCLTLALIELGCRILGAMDAFRGGPRLVSWSPALSTKRAIEPDLPPPSPA